MGGEPADLWNVVSRMPAAQLLFTALFFATWLIGGNVVIARHYQRIGQSAWSGFKFGAFPFRKFNLREWLTLIAVATVALVFGLIAVLIAEATQ